MTSVTEWCIVNGHYEAKKSCPDLIVLERLHLLSIDFTPFWIKDKSVKNILQQAW